MNTDHESDIVPGLSRRAFLIGSAAFASLPALIAACGGSTSNTSGGAASKTTLKVALYNAIIDLNPHGPNDVDTGTMVAARQIYDSLVVREGEKYVPSLAKSWKQTTPTTWVFTLRDDVQFHDGSKLTAADVKASLQAVTTGPSTPQTSLWATLASVEANDDTTITLTTTSPLGTMLVNLSLLFITPAAQMSQPNFYQKPIGSGPFKVESFVASNQLTLLSNKNYWGVKPKVDGLTIQFISEAAGNTAAIKSGQVSVNWPISSDQIQPLKGATDIKLKTVPSYNYYWNWFNSSHPPFNNKLVRQAMWHAVDVGTIVKSLFGSSAVVMKAPIPSTVFGYAPQKAYKYDPDLAKQLLRQAGLASGFQTSVNWYSTSGPQIDELAQTLISYWSKIGVKVTPNNLEEAEWLSRLLALDWDMDLQAELDTTGDADYNLGRLYLSTAHRNGYANPTLDQVLLQARASSDQSQRAKLYAQACQIIWDDAVGIFPCTLLSTYAVSSAVKGFTPVPSEQPYFNNVSVAH